MCTGTEARLAVGLVGEELGGPWAWGQQLLEQGWAGHRVPLALLHALEDIQPRPVHSVPAGSVPPRALAEWPTLHFTSALALVGAPVPSPPQPLPGSSRHLPAGSLHRGER